MSVAGSALSPSRASSAGSRPKFPAPFDLQGCWDLNLPAVHMTLQDHEQSIEPEADPGRTASEKGPRVLGDLERQAITDTYAALRSNVPGFRPRRAQAQMIGACSRALANEGGIALVEAGTGTGKSLAYLTTGMTLAQMHNLTLLIATGTVGLQEQLVNRDIPMFLKATKIDSEPVIAKGRNRYACPRNMNLLASNSGSQSALALGLDDDLADAGSWPRPPRKGEPEKVQKLFEKLQRGQWDGDLDNPPLRIDDQLRPLLSTSSAACSGRKCPMYHGCPYFRARAALDKARVIVANHALLMADLQFAGDKDDKFGGVLLPDLSKCLVIVDEGHQLPHTVINASASSAHPSSIIRRSTKWASFIRAAYTALGKEQIARNTVSSALDLVESMVAQLRTLEQDIRLTWVPDPRDGEFAQYRAPMGELPESWRDRAAAAYEVAAALHRLVKGLRRALNDADDLPAGAKAVLPRELGMMQERLSELSDVLNSWSREPRADNKLPPVAKWVRLSGKSDPNIVLCSSPTTGSHVIRERIFGQAAGVVVTSATLSAGGDFRAVAAELGLPRHGEVMSLSSPFDYQKQAVLQVPWMSAPANDLAASSREIAEWLDSNLDPRAGNLVLFTSKAKLAAVADLLEEPLKSVTRLQHSKPKAELLTEHTTSVRDGTGSTLFGLTGMGEGLSLEGDLCTTVVITALPFKVPTDPVEATYAEWVEARGMRPFDEITIPNAIRVLTQFVGRLLRHEDDRGRVVVLDRRLADRAFGRRILNALPPFRVEIEPAPR